ncbi:hypothetical protein HKD37_17G047891 [Glycine soja]
MMIQRTNRLRILSLNTLKGTSFVVQVEGISTWVVVLRTREGTSLVDQFKWRVHPLGCSKRIREDTSLVDLWFVKDFIRLKEISRTGGCLGTGCRHGQMVIVVVIYQLRDSGTIMPKKKGQGQPKGSQAKNC